MNLLQAIWIGLCQTLSAVFPGTSRSMSTIAAGQIAGLDRPPPSSSVFLLSIPTMIAATGWDLIKEVHSSHGAAAHVDMTADRWIVLFIGPPSPSSWPSAWWSGSCFGCASTDLPSLRVYRILLGAALLLWGTKYIGG